MKKILTIVIPAYNIAPYINTIMNSLIASKYLNQLDILIVNDGSKDNTVEKAKIYEEQYCESIKVIDKENGGHGSTINAGIKEAKGKYFKVLDGDDWVSTSEMDKLLEKMSLLDNDMIVSNFSYVDNDGKILENVNSCPDSLAYNKTFDIEEVCHDTFPFPFHSLYFKTEIYKRTKKIDEKCFYVDVEYALYPIEFVKTVYFCKENVYMYRLGNEGQSVSMVGYIKNRWNLKTVLFSLCEFYNLPKLSEVKKDYILRRIQAIYADIVEVYLVLGNKTEANKYLPIINVELKERYPELYCKMNNKLANFVKKHNYRFYKIVCIWRKFIKK